MPVQRYLQLAKESSFGESPAPIPAVTVDLLSASLDAPTDTEVAYEGGFGRGMRTHRAGVYVPQGNVVLGADVFSLPYLLYSLFNGYKFTDEVAGPPDTHEFWQANSNILNSLAAWLGKDWFEHRMAGLVVSQLQLTTSDGYIQATADCFAQQDFREDIKALSGLTLPSARLLMFHEITATRDAGDISASVVDLTLTINNGVDAAAGRGIGSRFPYLLPTFSSEVTATMTLRYNSEAELQRFWGSASGPDSGASGTTPFNLAFAINSGAEGSMNIAMPNSIYTASPVQWSGQGEITQSVAITAYRTTHTLADAVTTVDSEILVTVSSNTPDLSA